jgi:DnaJ-class molecular chaperone
MGSCMNIPFTTKLEKTCDECGGTGRDWYDEGIGEPCWKCQGTGHVATNEGKAILQLIAHHQNDLLQFA